MPNFPVCEWAINASDPQGVVNVRISNQKSKIQTVWCNQTNRFEKRRVDVHDTEYPELYNSFSVDLCPDEVDVTYQSLGNMLSLRVFASFYGGAAPLSIQFSSSGPEAHCPVDSSRVIVVQKILAGDRRYFLGMNRVTDHGQPQTCTWKLVAPDGMVIMVYHVYSMDYNSSFSDDTLQFDDRVGLTMRDNSRFPMWSENSTSLVRFHAHPGSYGKRFGVSYAAVPKGQCQGHPVIVDTSFEPRNLSVPRMDFDMDGKRDCRWLFRTSRTGRSTDY